MQKLETKSAIRVATVGRAEHLFSQHQLDIYRRTDRLFCGLLVFQWLAGIAAALWLSPLIWEGTYHETHLHVWAAALLGGIIISFPVTMGLFHPGKTATRHFLGIGQMLMGALLIHLTGGRLETHFHVFGSLAFLSFYRDWRVLISSSAVVAADHFLRGYFWPQSVYGVLVASEWRWLEHAGWVVFEDIFLIQSCIRGVREMRDIAERQAQLEATREQIEEKVRQRTAELESLNKILETTAAEARQSEEKYRHTLNAAADAIIGVDEQGAIIEFNGAAEKTFGYRRAELIGVPIAAVFPERLREQHQARLHQLLISDTRHLLSWQGMELSGLTKAGNEIPLEISLSFLEVGGRKYLIGVFRDITRRKSAESERRQLEAQLAQAQKLESIGQLAAGIAHEINTPIQYVGDNVAFLRDAFGDVQGVLAKQQQLLIRAKNQTLNDAAIAEVEQALAGADLEYLSAEVPRAIEQTLEGLGRVAKIVQAMKEFSHPGLEGKVASDVNKLIDNTIAVAQNEWKYVAQLVRDFDPSLPLVPCVAGEFNQVILNLIVNAAHAIGDRVKADPEQKGIITISTRAAKESVEIRVKDTGTGISPEAHTKIFDPFFTTKPVGKGTGQGLAISHTVIVKKHGGSLTFETEVGRGSTFIIRLPIGTETVMNGNRALSH